MDKSLNGGIEMSTFIRRYAKYLNAKAYSYRVVGADFAKMKRGPNTSGSISSSSGNETLRTMSGDKILKTLPILQSQVDCLLEFDAHPRDLNNGSFHVFHLLFCSFSVILTNFTSFYSVSSAARIIING